MRKTIFYLLLVMMFLTSCKTLPKKIVIAYLERPITLKPNMVSNVSVNSVLDNFYNGLIEHDPFMRIKPSLAYAWTNVDDTTWIFYLRKNVYFHDGAPFTAEDVRYTLKKIINNPKSELRKSLDIIDRITVVDNYKIKIITKRVDPDFLEQLSSVFIESETTIEDNSLNGTGPLMAEMVKPNEIVAIPFPRYFGKKLKCNIVEIKFYRNYKKLIDDYRNGKIDLIAETNYFFLNEFRRYRRFIVRGLESTLRYMALNIKKYPLNNKDFRKAISYSINREKMTDVVYDGLATPANQYALPYLLGYDINAKNMYNLDSARYYIKKSGVKLPVKLHITASKRRIDMINFLSEELSKIGIEVIPDTPRVSKLLFKKINSGDFDAFLLGSVPNIPDLSDVLMSLFYARKKEKGSHNRTGYSNKEVNDLLDSLTIKNAIDREELEKKVQRVILDDLPIIPLVYEKNYYITSSKIEFTPTSSNQVSVKEIKFE